MKMTKDELEMLLRTVHDFIREEETKYICSLQRRSDACFLLEIKQCIKSLWAVSNYIKDAIDTMDS